MKISTIEVITFRTTVDRFRNGHAQPQQPILQTLTRITTDDGAEGFCLGGHGHGDQDGLPKATQALLTDRILPLIRGQHPFQRERIWQWLWAAKIPEHVIGVVDMALWDLLGRVTGIPVYQLLGSCRDRVKAYASTYPNLGTPDVYAAHALACKSHGYRAYKIHPYYYWNPMTKQEAPGRPSHISWDLQICRAVREAVGDDMELMYDPWGTYHTYEEALLVGRELERLGFSWFEHPMPEHRVEPYIRLSRELNIRICSPEIIDGSVFSRADWIHRQAADVSRIDVLRGGITAAMKTAAVCEAYGVKCEIHMSGFGNLHVLGATSEDTCEYYERGLLAPGVDYDASYPYLKAPCDPLDADGYVRLPQGPGLGYDIDWDYVNAHRVEVHA